MANAPRPSRPRPPLRPRTPLRVAIPLEDAAEDTGLWLRYTLSSPRRPSDAAGPVAELWAMFFDRRDPTRSFGAKRTVPFAEASVDKDRFRYAIGPDAEITQTGCRGAIGDRIAWDLRWPAADKLAVHFPYDAMYTGALPKTKVVSPHAHLHASGSYTALGETFPLDGVAGWQSHLWGTQHAHRWVWAKVNTFAEDPSASFEGLKAQVKIGPLKSPPLTAHLLTYRGADYRFNRPIDLLKANEAREGDGRFTVFTVSGGNAEIRFRGEIAAPAERFLGVRYTDPDGSGRICCHSKLAEAKLEILLPDRGGGGGWRVADTLHSRSAALELVGPDADPRIPVTV